MAWLRKRKARTAEAVAAAALEAAHAQHTVLPGQYLAAAMAARLAEEVINLDTEIANTETMIEERFRRHRDAEIILSMPGFGVILGAEFLAATGGDMNAFDTAGGDSGDAAEARARREAEEAEAAKRERRKVLALNKLGDAAASVRREFVRKLLARPAEGCGDLRGGLPGP